MKSKLFAKDLDRRTVARRAVEAVIWGMPAVNFDVMYQAMVRDAKAGAGSNKIVFWSRLLDWKNQTLTPNPDSVYFMPFFDTKDAGPVVLEIPPADGGSITGSIDDAWQTAIEDVGPAGVDKGKGGKYLAIGADPGSPTTPEYKPPFRFNGKIKRVQVDVSGESIEDKAARFRAMMARQ